MEKTIMAFLLISIFFGCNERQNQSEGNNFPTVKNDLVGNIVNYHKMIDLVLSTYSESYKNKIVYLEYKPVKNPLPEKYRDYILKHPKLNKKEKELALKLIETGKDKFEFNQKELSEESRNILKNLDKSTDRNITYVFNSFLSNDENDLVISTAGALINNESFTAATSGAELIIFFEKTKNGWEIINTISTIEY